MNTRGNDTLREMLAAEYALGTLRAGARRRFERLARHDEGLRTLALQWSERLLPLVDGIPSTVPPKRVWDAIETRLPGFAARASRPAALGWFDRLALWRGLSAAFATVAIVAIGIATHSATRPPTIVERTIVEPPKVVRIETGPAAVATLLDPKTSQPVALVMTSQSGTALSIKVAPDVEVPEGKTLQLWLAPKDADGLLSMGVLPGDPRRAVEQVRSIDRATLARAKAFGLSLEPTGGSAKPTKVLGLGVLIGVTS